MPILSELPLVLQPLRRDSPSKRLSTQPIGALTSHSVDWSICKEKLHPGHNYLFSHCHTAFPLILSLSFSTTTKTNGKKQSSNARPSHTPTRNVSAIEVYRSMVLSLLTSLFYLCSFVLLKDVMLFAISPSYR